MDYSRTLDIGSFRRNYFGPALARAGLPDMRFHDLRHTAASLWIAAGFRVMQVSRWLGHSSTLLTDQVYSDLYPTDYEQHLDRFDAFRAAQ